VTAESIAPYAEGGEARTALGRRLSPWRLLVAGSAAVLVAAAAVMAGLWAVTSDRTSTSYTASGALLGIEIEVARGDIEILGGGPDVLVRRTARSLYGHEPHERRVIAGGVLRIESSCAALVVGSCRSDYRITVPESVSITIAAERGDVRLTGYRGSADLATKGGSISADAFCGHTLQATARGGSIDVAAICSPEHLELRTDTGNVEAVVPPGRYGIDAETNAGAVAVRGLERDPAAPWTIRALSNSGDVTLAGRS